MATAPITTFLSSSVPLPTASAGNSTAGSDSNQNTSSATLYLYTFLATLVLLLAVSAAIVIRSYLIRTRQRRLLNDAVRDGLLVPSTPGRAPFTFLRKPVLLDLYLASAPAEKARRQSFRSEASTRAGWWNAVMVSRISPRARSDTREAAPAPPTTPPSTFARLRRNLRIASVDTAVLPAPATAAGPRQPESVELSAIPLSVPPRRSLDVGFLIAMPAPPVSHHEAGDLPYVEFGIARVAAAPASDPLS
ncbi:hypothetical protein C8Q72DRAFT_905007 [Fomitopsis betulina]|nr:hypothetical protein C8Q72DRAFT_905007 [Fomitopsis betulina]